MTLTLTLALTLTLTLILTLTFTLPAELRSRVQARRGERGLLGDSSSSGSSSSGSSSSSSSSSCSSSSCCSSYYRGIDSRSGQYEVPNMEHILPTGERGLLGDGAELPGRLTFILNRTLTPSPNPALTLTTVTLTPRWARW